MSNGMDNTGDDADKGPQYAWWVPEQALNNLSMEKALHGHETSLQLAKRLLEENAPMAIASIVHLATYESDPRIRLSASKYIADATLGAPGKEPAMPEGGNAWDKVFDVTLVEATNTKSEPKKW